MALAYGAPRNVYQSDSERSRSAAIHVRRQACGPPTILFVGSFRHLPNLLAFEMLRESIMPAVWREFPDAVLM